MKYKLEIDVENDTFQDIADRLTEYFKTLDNYVGPSKEVKSWLFDKVEPIKDIEGICIYEVNNGIRIIFKGVYVEFNYKTRKTGKTERVSKLRKIELYEFDKVVFSDFNLHVDISSFEKGERDWTVKKTKWVRSVSSSYFKGKSFSKYTFKQALELGLDNLYVSKEKKNVKDIILNSMAQPYYQNILENFFSNTEEQVKEESAQVIINIEKYNKELLEEYISKLNW